MTKKLTIVLMIAALLVLGGCGQTASEEEDATTVNPWQPVGGAGFTDVDAFFVSLEIAANGTPYVAYRELGGARGESATVMKYSGVQWEFVGSAGLSEGDASYLSMEIADDDSIYLAYRGESATEAGKATVMEYNFGSKIWEAVPAIAISSGDTSYVDLATYSNNNPVIAYSDNSDSDKLTVLSYNGSAWSALGSVGISVGEARFIATAVDSGDVVYTAYCDSTYSDKVVVMYYDGTWHNKGNATGISNIVAKDIDIEIHPTSNQPYIVYSDGGDLFKVKVLRWDSTLGDWTSVGEPLTTGRGTYCNIEFNSLGVPYVAFSDTDRGEKTTVMAFVDGSWSYSGNPGLSSGSASYQSLAIDSGTDIPYVSYQDANGKLTVMKLN